MPDKEVYTTGTLTDISDARDRSRGMASAVSDLTTSIFRVTAPSMSGSMSDGHDRRLELFIFTLLSANLLADTEDDGLASSGEINRIVNGLVAEFSAILLEQAHDVSSHEEVSEYIKTLFVSNLKHMTLELAEEYGERPLSAEQLARSIYNYLDSICKTAPDVNITTIVSDIIKREKGGVVSV
jgi:hypothetical protein